MKERLSTGRIKITSHNASVEQQEAQVTGPASKMSAFETNKHFKNNPLKDISNQMSNLQNQHEKEFHEKKQSLPFEIAPKQIKINNFLEMPSSKTNDKNEE